MIQLIEAGKTFKTYGLSGTLNFDVDDAYLDFIEAEKVLFFMVEGNAVPFFIEDDCDLEEGRIRFKDIDNPESAKLLSNAPFYIDGSRWKGNLDEPELRDTDEEIVGYTFFDETSSKSGVVQDIEEFPSQILLQVIVNNKLFYVPLREEWMLELNPDKKILKMMLPEGMFD